METIKKRRISYILAFLFLPLAYCLLWKVEWKSTALFHTCMEVIAMGLAFTAGKRAYRLFKETQDYKFAIFGYGLYGVAALDGYHAVVTSWLFKSYFPSGLGELIPWSWVASRLFLSVVVILSLFFYKREIRLGKAAKLSPTSIKVFFSLLTLIIFLFFAFYPLPKAYYPELVFHRPEEFIPALLFFLGFVGYYKKKLWQTDNFEHYLLISLIVGFISQALFMSLSGTLFDLEFDIAHLLKKVSYIFMIMGISYGLKTSRELPIEEEQELFSGSHYLDRKITITSFALLVGATLIINIVNYQGDKSIFRENAKAKLRLSNSMVASSFNGILGKYAEDLKIVAKSLIEGKKSGNFSFKDYLKFNHQVLNLSFVDDNKTVQSLKLFETKKYSINSREKVIVSSVQKSKDYFKINLKLPVYATKEIAGHLVMGLRLNWGNLIPENINDLGNIEINNGRKKLSKDFLVVNSKLESPSLIFLKNILITSFIKLDHIEGLALSFFYRNLFLSIILISLIMVFMWLLVSLELSPLTYISETMKRFPKNRTIQSLPINEKGEIGEISRSFTFVSKEILASEKSAERQANILDRYAYVCHLDSGKKIISTNSLFLERFRYSEDEIIGKSFEDIFINKKDLNLSEEIFKVIDQGEIWRGELSSKIKDGQFCWTDTIIAASEVTNGDSLGFITISIDITNRKKAENTKAEFLANMSHEIRTPMNGVLGMVDVLKGTELSLEQKEVVETISSSGKTLLTVINDILDFSKIQAGKVDLEEINFNLKDLVQEVVHLFSTITSQKIISISVSLQNLKKEFFIGDEIRIRQILNNLLSNAVKFTPSNGKIDVSAETLRIRENHYTVLIRVKDNGIGISSEEQEKLFKPFSQADSSTTREYGGTGLGLSISQKLANAMNGEIGVKSIKGVGSEFYFSLPLSAGQEVSEVNEPQLDESNLKDIKKTKILLVEDNIINQKVACLVLRKFRLDVDVASNGLEALKCVEANNYELIFMDMQMPKMDGLQATREIIKKYGEKSPPIIALTANVLQEDKEKCLNAGILDVVPKPIQRDNIKNILVKYLS